MAADRTILGGVLRLGEAAPLSIASLSPIRLLRVDLGRGNMEENDTKEERKKHWETMKRKQQNEKHAG